MPGSHPRQAAPDPSVLDLQTVAEAMRTFSELVAEDTPTVALGGLVR